MKKIHIIERECEINIFIGTGFELKPIVTSMWKASYKNGNIYFPSIEKPKINRFMNYGILMHKLHDSDKITIRKITPETVFRIMLESDQNLVFWHNM